VIDGLVGLSALITDRRFHHSRYRLNLSRTCSTCIFRRRYLHVGGRGSRMGERRSRRLGLDGLQRDLQLTLHINCRQRHECSAVRLHGTRLPDPSNSPLLQADPPPPHPFFYGYSPTFPLWQLWSFKITARISLRKNYNNRTMWLSGTFQILPSSTFHEPSPRWHVAPRFNIFTCNLQLYQRVENAPANEKRRVMNGLSNFPSVGNSLFNVGFSNN
jgi:hypothetical protein